MKKSLAFGRRYAKIAIHGLLACAGVGRTYQHNDKPVFLQDRFVFTFDDVGSYLVSEIELFLGIWLLWGIYRYWCSRVVLSLFILLAAISLYLGATGQASCGCFGRVEVSPWLALGIDLAGIVLLIAAIRWSQDCAEVALPGIFRVTCRTAVILVGLIIGIYFTVQNPQEFLSRLRGDTITLTPTLVDVGIGTKGEVREITVLITNHGDESISIIGGQATCACVTTESLPVTLLPHSQTSITIQAKFSGKGGRFVQRYLLLTSSKQAPTLVGHLKGYVHEATTAVNSPTKITMLSTR